MPHWRRSAPQTILKRKSNKTTALTQQRVLVRRGKARLQILLALLLALDVLVLHEDGPKRERPGLNLGMGFTTFGHPDASGWKKQPESSRPDKHCTDTMIKARPQVGLGPHSPHTISLVIQSAPVVFLCS